VHLSPISAVGAYAQSSAGGACCRLSAETGASIYKQMGTVSNLSAPFTLNPEPLPSNPKP